MSTTTVTDSELHRDVLEVLEWEPSVDAANVDVLVENGTVILRRHVPSYAERNLAERVGMRVYGVKAVINELDVKLPGDSRRSDQEIAVGGGHQPDHAQVARSHGGCTN